MKTSFKASQHALERPLIICRAYWCFFLWSKVVTRANNSQSAWGPDLKRRQFLRQLPLCLLVAEEHDGTKQYLQIAAIPQKLQDKVALMDRQKMTTARNCSGGNIVVSPGEKPRRVVALLHLWPIKNMALWMVVCVNSQCIAFAKQVKINSLRCTRQYYGQIFAHQEGKSGVQYVQ